VNNEPATPEPTRVLVVDDQELFRRGLTMLLAAEDGIEVVGEAGDGIEGVALATRTAPDVVSTRSTDGLWRAYGRSTSFSRTA
jgi:two-component system NarL family response regulator